ncbi:alpha/beta hydrolase [Streptomyces sp. Tu 2975]|uniref:alpha/beta hydrolase n=1 Tax=Streptomyces sp. Tu 2975 TaxID=2676871 RepID=UPI001359C356|nr:alpha/beta fold hydrolase [Streptomyces sp. Tu 2975]QIP88327.1 alpha/beta hydrolase [Streptomyces sp. Tu 2975]
MRSAAAAEPCQWGSSPGVHPITLDAGGISLSGLCSEPAQETPRAVIIALHGGGMNAGYFDGQAHPDVSLLALGARLGYTVLALDRPGYGASAAHLPEGQRLTTQAATVRCAVQAFTARRAPGAGTFMLAHSFGAKVAFAAVADWDTDLLGLDVSGCGRRLAASTSLTGSDRGGRGSLRRLNWGPLSLYPPETFRASQSVVAPMPARETSTVAGWLRLSAAILPRVRVPVRLTFAEHEAWWCHGENDLADLAALLSAAPRIVTDRLPQAGHNISLGWAARAYHLKALAFFEECLTAKDTQRQADSSKSRSH